MQLLSKLAFALTLATGAAPALAAQPDLTELASFKATCPFAKRDPATLSDNRERQAFVICRDIDLTAHIITLASTIKDRYTGQKPGDIDTEARFRRMIRDELGYARDELRTARLVLEKIKLAKGEGLLLAPAQWQVDLNGDGKVDTWEQYFFAIPARGHSRFDMRMPSDDPDYYAREYALDARIHVDQSDIAWTLSYHYFAEGLLETILAYEWKKPGFGSDSIELVDPAGMKRASRLMTQGFKTSEAMRRMVLAETDDDLEWIGNERQASSVFPIPLDATDFRVWGELMAQVIPLFEGKTLIVPSNKAGGMLGAMSQFCPSGQGLSVTKFYNNPPRYPLTMLMLPPDLHAMCQKIDKQHAPSGLFDFIVRYADRAQQQDGAGMRFLRQLLWVN